MLSKRIKSKLILSTMAGPVFFILLFVYGLLNNMSMSYMGNRNETIEGFIIDNFLGHIIVFLLKTLSVYLVIGFVFGIAAEIMLLSYSKMFNKKFSIRRSFLYNFFIIGFLFIITFFKDIIIYPQVYMNNFYIKNDVNRFIMEALTDNINPLFFTILQGLFLIIFAGLITVLIIKSKNEILNIAAVSMCSIALIIYLISMFGGAELNKNHRPNVIVLASDALRPDHLSGYGYSRDTSPNIDRLINEGVSFRETFIEVPRTFPSWVSILTGQFASTHGIRHMFPTSMDRNREFKSIVKVLKDKGYFTSVVADFAGDIFSRIELGFESVDVPYFNFDYIIEQVILDGHTFLMPFLTSEFGLRLFPVLMDSASFCPPSFLTKRIIDNIDESSGRPFFLASFFSSTHFPYASPYPYYKLYAEKDYRGPYKYYKQRVLSMDSNDKQRISDEDIIQIRALYDGGLKAFDDEVGNILKHLEEKDVLNNTIVILLSDHGENLYEEDFGMGHGEHFRGFYSTRVPFVIRFPKRIKLQKKEIYETVRPVDISPTILDLVEEPIPDYMEGVSLVPVIRGEKIAKLNAFGETGIWFDNNTDHGLFFQKQRILYPDIASLSVVDFHFDNQVVLNDEYSDIVNLAKHRYVYDGRYKLIYMPLRDRVIYEMYDTHIDPLEKNNLASIDKKNFHRLRKILFEWMKRNGDVYIRKDFVYPVMRY